VVDFILGERRREPRAIGEDVPDGFTLVLPGVRAVEVLDSSSSGVRVRTPTPVRPGRLMTVRCRDRTGAPDRTRNALVVRCWVQRIGRGGVTYEAGLTFDTGRPT
jgi:hypothetical protein